jgi:hypothetical protein
MTHELLATCPYCFEEHALVSNKDGLFPTPGDFSICWVCASVSAYDEDLNLVHLTEEQIETVNRDDEIRTIRVSVMESLTPHQAVDFWRQLTKGKEE